MIDVLESSIEAYLVKIVKQLGGEIRKLQWIGRRGAPDRLVLLPDGWIYWIELKRPGKEAEAHQTREHDRIRDMGQIVVVLDTLAKIDEFFAKHFVEE